MNARRPVLIVEDDDDIREAVEDALVRAGYPVLAAEDGRAALAQLQRGVQPAVILLDLTMPVMNGWEFLDVRAKDPALATIPVVVLSAVTRLEQQPGSERWAGVLKKPIKLADLLGAVARFA